MTNLELIQSKIIDGEELDRLLTIWRFKNKKIVFTNGCFDILHLGHIDYLAKARDEGDVLIIGLNTDESVRRIKGPQRPLNNQDARSVTLAALRFADAVVLFDEDTPYELIKKVQPDILVKGNDYKAEDIVGYDIVKSKGGEIRTLELVKGYSTSNMLEKLSKTSG